MSPLRGTIARTRSIVTTLLALVLISGSVAGAADDPVPPAAGAPEADPIPDEALPALVRACVAGDASAEERLRAQGPPIVPRVRPLLGEEGAPALRRLVREIARDALRRSIEREGSVRYRGQFASLAPLGPEGAEVLLEIFSDEDALLDERNRAATALGDIGGPAQATALRRLADDFLVEEWVEREARFLLARFGDRSLVDPLLAELRQIAARELTAATLPAILTAHGELAEIHYRIDEYDLAVEHYRKKQALLVELLGRVRPELREALEEEIELLQYNLACSLALAGKIDEAFAALDRSMASRGVTLDMLRTDGDLRAVRADPRYEAKLAEWTRRREAASDGAESPVPEDPEEPAGGREPPPAPEEGGSGPDPRRAPPGTSPPGDAPVR